MNEDTFRFSWIPGDRLEIYSVSKCQWFAGLITDLFEDEEGEWLEVEYKRSISKQVQRGSVNIRPHPGDYHRGRSQLLIDGYCRWMQCHFFEEMELPSRVSVLLMAFYFVGNAPFLDDGSRSRPDRNLTVQNRHRVERPLFVPTAHDTPLSLSLYDKASEDIDEPANARPFTASKT